MPTLVCVTPTFNAEDLVFDTINSIKNQTALLNGSSSEIEILHIIVDGGSTDNTLMSIQQAYADVAEQDNLKFVCVSEPDNGMYDAIAKGFKLASEYAEGDIFCYLNAGDMFSPQAASICAESYDTPGYAWWTGLHAHYNEAGHLVSLLSPGKCHRALIAAGLYGRLGFPFIQQESTFWTRELHSTICWEKLSSLKYAGDHFLWATFSEKTDLKTLPIWLGGFRRHTDQKSKKYRKEYELEKLQVSAALKMRVVPNLIFAFFRYVIPYRLAQCCNYINNKNI